MATVSANAQDGGISRREFLYYIWGASMALFTLQSTGLLVWFLIPKFREGEFGGRFWVDVNNLPEVNAPPANFPDGRFWMVQLDSSQPNDRMGSARDEDGEIRGVAAIYKVCTHLGCIYDWIQSNNRFECPCHGSKYRLDGRRIEDPAPRTLDRFKVEAYAEDRITLLAEAQLVDNFYEPLELPEGTAFLSVDTGDRRQGPSDTLLCSFEGTCP
ncbi:MAG: ubiquinol-cytochrome c reductase iron-sulfur subunit [Chloroflexota bacterium]|jgi:cytochrome b6-f complex iron-sulfur subunit